MKIQELLFLLQWGTLAAAISLLIYKYWYLAVMKKTEQAKSKWLGWYQYEELREMNCPQLWENMQQNNRITTAMWICGAVSMSLFLANAFS